jgi:hypothetical protein
MPDARSHPQPRVRNKKAHEHSHHRYTAISRHSLRDGFNGFLRALPGDRAFLSPSPRGYRRVGPVRTDIASTKLDAGVETSEPHDFTVRIERCSPSAPTRPPHSEPNVRDDGDTPLQWDRNDVFLNLIWVKREPIYFFERDWTGSIGLIRFNKSRGRRTENLEIPRCAIAHLRSGAAHHPGMTVQERWP